MIFVTVGTHEQQFDRLIKEVDRLKKENLVHAKVLWQDIYVLSDHRKNDEHP